MKRIALLMGTLTLGACAGTDAPFEPSDEPVVMAERDDDSSEGGRIPGAFDDTQVPDDPVETPDVPEAPEPTEQPDPTEEPDPTEPPDPEPVARVVLAVDTGIDTTCAVVDDGRVYCWGGTYGLKAVPVVGVVDAVDIAAGVFHFCALRSTGGVQCWGDNAAGQLGDGSTTSSPSPVEVVGLTDAVGITAAQSASCALRSNGEAVCWGARYDVVPQRLFDLTGLEQVTLGDAHGCARVFTGDVWCWGHNSYGELGNGPTTTDALPAVVAGYGFADVSAGNSLTCGVNADDTATCWGRNGEGQHGAGDFDANAVKRAVLGPDGMPLGGIVSVSASNGLHACALLDDGRVACWGNNGIGQLGDGGADGRPYADYVMGLDDAVDVVTGIFETCAIRMTGELACWGSNANGQLGNGESGNLKREPTPITVL